jgi:hypothetical protein
MSRPSQGTVESLISELGGIVPVGSQSFELWVPQQLTLRGQPVRADVAGAVILDKILGMGFQPDGFSEAEGGRVYRYKVLT